MLRPEPGYNQKIFTLTTTWRRHSLDVVFNVRIEKLDNMIKSTFINVLHENNLKKWVYFLVNNASFALFKKSHTGGKHIWMFIKKLCSKMNIKIYIFLRMDIIFHISSNNLTSIYIKHFSFFYDATLAIFIICFLCCT